MTATAPGVLDLRGSLPEPGALEPAANHLRSGGLILYPTETVYGLGGPCTPEGAQALASLKGRAPTKPFLVLIPDPSFVTRLAWTSEAQELADVFWPGALTLVLQDPHAIFPPGIRGDDGTVAVRHSPHPVVEALLRAYGGPITSTSANRPGSPPARSGEGARIVAADLRADRSLMILDAGALPPSASSTIVDCTGNAPVVVRAGSIPTHRLRCALPDIHERPTP